MPAKEERRRLKKQYGELLEAISEILGRHDPIRISSADTEREYDPEASTILTRLRECASETEALAAVHQTFVDCFDAPTAGPISAYAELAREIWEVWTARGTDSGKG